MTLSLSYHHPWRLSRLSLPLQTRCHCFFYSPNPTAGLFFKALNLSLSKPPKIRASSSSSSSLGGGDLDPELLGAVCRAKDAEEALQVIDEMSERKSGGGVVSASNCCAIISAALERNNPDLALSLFHAMRTSFDQGASESGERWKWSRPDVKVYTSLVQGLAASLRVSDALTIIANICQVGVSPAEEVPFGKVVRCPSCSIAVGVAQPQQGIQIVSCSTCRYKYELVSGNIVSIASEEIRMSISRTQHGYSSMEKRAQIPADYQTEHSFCGPLYRGRNTGWSGSYAPICDRDG